MTEDDKKRETEARRWAEDLWAQLRGHTSPMAGVHMSARQYGVTFWDESVPAVLYILANALLKPPGGATGSTYGGVLLRWVDALRDDKKERAKTLFDLMEVLRQEFPAECQAWSDHWSLKGKE